MTYLRQPAKIRAEHVVDVRKTLGETQAEFGHRFDRSRFAVIRWEKVGAKFQIKSKRSAAWRVAAAEARHLIDNEGTAHDATENLRTLQTLPS